MLFLLTVLLLITTALSESDCSYTNGAYTAKWKVTDGNLVIELSNEDLSDNQWTAIGFGTSMNDQEVILLTVENNKPQFVTGHTEEYNMPLRDDKSYINEEYLEYTINSVYAKFSLPLKRAGPRNKDLTECSQWNFVTGGNVAVGVIGYHKRGLESKTVCPQKCK